MKDVGWSAPRVEIEARTITENLDRFTELGTAPGVKEPISYLQTISSLEALLRPHIPLPWSAATFPLCRENLDCGGNLADNANSLSLIFPFTFDLLVTNGHSSEQVSVWDDGQPDDCVCETFVLSRRAVQPCSDPIIALFR